MKYDLIDLPGELNDIPACGACYDTGIICDEDVFCDCPKGDAALDACDDFDCGEHGLFEDDADALASAGMGTDEDYGCF